MARPPVKGGVGDELARALCATIATMCGVAVEARTSRGWASATFSGQRHALRLRLDGPAATAAADRLLGGLDEREFALDGHILADIAPVLDERAADGRRVRLELEALTVEAA